MLGDRDRPHCELLRLHPSILGVAFSSYFVVSFASASAVGLFISGRSIGPVPELYAQAKGHGSLRGPFVCTSKIIADVPALSRAEYAEVADYAEVAEVEHPAP